MCQSTHPLTPPFPVVPGREVCGAVDGVGDAVEIALGTLVRAATSFFDGRGGFAESTITAPVRGTATTLAPSSDHNG